MIPILLRLNVFWNLRSATLRLGAGSRLKVIYLVDVGTLIAEQLYQSMICTTIHSFILSGWGISRDMLWSFFFPLKLTNSPKELCLHLRAVRAELAFEAVLLVSGNLCLGMELREGTVTLTLGDPPDVAVALVVDSRHMGRLRSMAIDWMEEFCSGTWRNQSMQARNDYIQKSILHAREQCKNTYYYTRALLESDVISLQWLLLFHCLRVLPKLLPELNCSHL